MGRKKYTNTTKAQLLMGELSGLGRQFKPNLVPEIKLRYNKGRRVLGNVKSSEDAADFIRAQYKRSAGTGSLYGELFPAGYELDGSGILENEKYSGRF